MEALDGLFLFGVTSAAAKLLVCYASWDRRPQRAELVGHVTRLSLYPVKSMKGIRLKEVDCTYVGFRQPGSDIHDRCWLVVYGEENRFVTARQEPTLLLVQPLFGYRGNDEAVEQLCFSAPQMEPLKIPLRPENTRNKLRVKVQGSDSEAYDCGAEAAAWISTYLKTPGHRLLYHDPSDSGVLARSARQLKRIPMFLRDEFKPEDKMTFHDDAPYLMTHQSSLDGLTSRTDDDTITMETFRPSIVVSGNRPAFDEDTWAEIYIGSTVKMTSTMHCSRCMLTTLDETKGKQRANNEPLKTLNSFRRVMKCTESPCFGIYLVCDRPGTVQLNDPVYVLRR